MKIITMLVERKYILICCIVVLSVYLFQQLAGNGFNQGQANKNNATDSQANEQPPSLSSSPFNVVTENEQAIFVSELNDNKKQLDASSQILALNMFKLASVDGDITVDKNEELVVDRDLRHWIDFYLSAIGELSLVEIQQLMNQKIALLPMPARQQAEKLLADYLAYKEALASYEGQFQLLEPESIDHLENLQQRHDWQKRLRRQMLSTEAVEAFWQLDELVDDYALEQLVINGSDMSDEEKLYQLKKSDDALPAELKNFRRDLYIASNLQEKVVSSRQQGGSDESIRQLRIEQVGLKATDRLEVLEAAQNLWQQRVVDYANEVKAVAAIEGLTEQDKNERIRLYQHDNFDNKEQLRLDTALSLLIDK